MARKKSVTCQRGGTCASFSLVNVAFDPTLIPGIHVLHILSSFHTGPPRDSRAFYSLYSLWQHKEFHAGGREGAGVLHTSLYGEAPPRCPTPYSFMYYFWEKRYPFRIPSIDKSYPSHIPSLELCIPFHCLKFTVFKNNIINNSQNQSVFSTFSQP